MAAEPSPTLRADARRNRDRIVASAKEWFASHGADVPVEDIAHTACVGVGTLYRRFPDREALIRAVARDNFANALAEARAAAVEEPTAWQALVRFLRQSTELRLCVQLAMTSPAARSVIKGDPHTEESRLAMLDVLDAVVHAAQAEGTLRPDIGTGDVAMVFVLLIRQVPLPNEKASPVASERCMALMLDGLRAHPGSVLPGHPLSSADLGL
jgi:AcrR family transcriptional regulator